MPGQYGNNLYCNAEGSSLIYNAALTYPSLTANTSGTNTATIAGLAIGDLVYIQMTAPPGHIFLENAYVSAANTVTISWTTDSTGVTGSTMPVTIFVLRPDKPQAQLPTGMS